MNPFITWSLAGLNEAASSRAGVEYVQRKQYAELLRNNDRTIYHLPVLTGNPELRRESPKNSKFSNVPEIRCELFHYLRRRINPDHLTRPSRDLSILPQYFSFCSILHRKLGDAASFLPPPATERVSLEICTNFGTLLRLADCPVGPAGFRGRGGGRANLCGQSRHRLLVQFLATATTAQIRNRPRFRPESWLLGGAH